MQPASGLRGAREAHGPSGVPSRGYYGNVREEGEGRLFQTARDQVFLAKLIPLGVLGRKEKKKKKTAEITLGHEAQRADLRLRFFFEAKLFLDQSTGRTPRPRPRDAPLPEAVPQRPRTPHAGLSPAHRSRAAPPGGTRSAALRGLSVPTPRVLFEDTGLSGSVGTAKNEAEAAQIRVAAAGLSAVLGRKADVRRREFYQATK